ncbi:hypothetical protein [Photobacterium damselae]
MTRLLVIFYIEEKTANKLITELHEISNIIGGYIRYRSQHLS